MARASGISWLTGTSEKLIHISPQELQMCSFAVYFPELEFVKILQKWHEVYVNGRSTSIPLEKIGRFEISIFKQMQGQNPYAHHTIFALQQTNQS